MGEVVRCRSADELYQLLKQYQPRAVPLLGAALADDLGGWACRGFLWRNREDRCGGAVVLRRWLPLNWVAYAIVLDPAAAPALGAFVDRSMARVVEGFTADVEMLRPFLGRWRQQQEVRAATLPPGFDWPPPSVRTRSALPSDLARLTELAWLYAPHSIRWRRSLARRVRLGIDEGAVVVEVGDPPVIAGYAVIETRTPDYDQWAHAVVAPEFRGQGLSWELVAAALATTASRGVGALTSLIATNPMTTPEDARMPEPYQIVSLSKPRTTRVVPGSRGRSSR